MTSILPLIPQSLPPLHAPFDRVSLHFINLDDIQLPLDQLLSQLAPDECARAATFKHDLHRARFIRRRAWRRNIIAQLAAINPDELAIVHDSLGRPSITAPAIISHWHLSTSNSQSLAALAIVPYCNIGIDLAFIDPQHASPDAARVFMHPDELRDHLARPPRDQPANFHRLWTRKEAFLKTLGTGFATDPRTIDTRPDLIILPSASPFAPPNTPIHLTDLPLHPTCTAALAIHAHSATEPRL